MEVYIFCDYSLLLQQAANELRIDVEASTNAEAQFNAPPHQS
jgi:hypothetical protein